MGTYHVTLLICLTCLITLPACERYEMKEDKQGRTIRLDRLTGEIQILEGDKLVRAKSASEQEAEKSTVEKLSQRKDWQSIGQIGNKRKVEPHLSTMWNDGQLYFILELRGTSEELEGVMKSWVRYTLHLTDGSNFNLVSIELPVSKFLRVVDGDRKVKSLQANDSYPCGRITYERIRGWSVSWTADS